MREIISFNRDWRFLPDPPEDLDVKTKPGAYLTAKTERLKYGPGAYQHYDVPNSWALDKELSLEYWQYVDLPHDYIIGQTPDPNESPALGFFHYHTAWYRKHFTLDEADQNKRLTIFFEGITGISDIYLNGCFLKHNNGGYVSFEVDITDLARFDQENVLAVHVDPRSYEGWWYQGGGIYRSVKLVKTDPVAVDLWGVFVPVAKLSGNQWKVPIEVTLKNIEFESRNVSVLCEIIAPDGKKSGEMVLNGTVPARENAVLTGETVLENPVLWDIDSPALYTMRVTVRKENEVCDLYEQKFGFREIVMDPDKGLFLNGRSVKVKGVCAHLDFGLTGKAVPDNICRYKMQMCKEMGANAYRTSHYPHQQAVMDACDELGILVMDETRRYETNEEAVSQLEMLVKRDRNHPSVFLWSTGNEEMAYHCIPQGHRIQKVLEHVIRKLDPTRPITTAVTNLHQATVMSDCEVIGSNYSLSALDQVHAEFPKKPFISTENCASGTSRAWYYGESPVHGRMDGYDQTPDPKKKLFWNGRETTWRFIMQRPWICGGFQWDAFEHRGEAIWPRLSSVSGAIDLFLQKKDAFYQNQSHWLDTPMIHLLPHWTHRGMEGHPFRVWAYTNCDEAELFFNGKSLGKKTIEKPGHAEWVVPYAPGRLEVIGYCDGKITVRDVQETAGPAVSLKLQLENGPVRANGEDIALFTCIALDAEGREVPDISPVIHFDCIGKGILVGTGSDNTDHVPVTSPDRRMYGGRISIAVKTLCEPGEITLIARSENSEIKETILTIVSDECKN